MYLNLGGPQDEFGPGQDASFSSDSLGKVLAFSPFLRQDLRKPFKVKNTNSSQRRKLPTWGLKDSWGDSAGP